MWFAQYGETKSKSREAHLDCQRISAACFCDASPIEDASYSLPKRLRRVVLLALRALSRCRSRAVRVCEARWRGKLFITQLPRSGVNGGPAVHVGCFTS